MALAERGGGERWRRFQQLLISAIRRPPLPLFSTVPPFPPSLCGEVVIAKAARRESGRRGELKLYTGGGRRGGGAPATTLEETQVGFDPREGKKRDELISGGKGKEEGEKRWKLRGNPISEGWKRTPQLSSRINQLFSTTEKKTKSVSCKSQKQCFLFVSLFLNIFCFL